VRCGVACDSFQPSLCVLAARFYARGLFGDLVLAHWQKEGDDAPDGATSPYVHAPFGGVRGASRRAVRRSPSAPVRAHWGTGFSDSANRVNPTCGNPASCVLPRSGPSARGSESGAARARGLLATPAGAGPIHTSRRNRFASLMGNGQVQAYSPIGILSRHAIGLLVTGA
jgi:hypothetical protein